MESLAELAECQVYYCHEVGGCHMDYNEAIDTTVSRAEARREIEKHCCSWAEFLQDVGDREEYEGYEVLDWLGY